MVMEEQNNTASLEKKILETNLPLRKELVEALKMLHLNSDESGLQAKLDDIKDRWENLGVPLHQEQELVASYQQLCQDIVLKSDLQKTKKKEEHVSIQDSLKLLEKFLKDEATLDEKAWVNLETSWASHQLDSNHPDQQNFERLSAKVSQKLKRYEHEEKCQLLEKLCLELEALKADRNKKLSERQNQIRSIRDQFKEINLHSGANVVVLRERFNTLIQELTQELSWERWSSSKRKEDLIQKAGQLIEQNQPHTFREELQKLQNEWKEIGFTSRDDDKLWEQFKAKCDEVYQNLKLIQDKNELKREQILKELDAHKDSVDWKKATEAIQKLQKDWIEAAPVSRKAGRKQGQTYKELCDHFFNRRRDHLKEIRSSQKDNIKEKKSLIEQVVKLQKEANWRNSLPKIKELQDAWKKVGPIPKKQSDELWKEFQDACSVIYDKRKSDNEVIDKEFEANAEKKEALLEDIKTAIEQSDLVLAQNELNKLEKQWSEIGKVPRSKQKQIEHRFRQLLKDFSDKEERVKREKHKQWLNLTQQKVELCLQMEELLFDKNFDEAKSQFETLQSMWEQMGNSQIEKPLKKRFHFCQRVFQSESGAIEGEFERACISNQSAMESLVLKLEKLVGIESDRLSVESQRQLMIAELQAKMGRSAQTVNKKDESEKLILELQTLGPIQPERRKTLQDRIALALAKINKIT